MSLLRSSPAVVALALTCTGCSTESAPVGSARAGLSSPVGAAALVAHAPTREAEQRLVARDRCKARIGETLARPDLGGTPGLDDHRAEIVARAKGEPVVFVRAPSAAEAGKVARAYRRAIETSRFPWDAVKRLAPRFAHRPDLGRDVLLRNGYLYAETPDLAHALYEHVELDHLYRASDLWIERGARRLRVKRGADNRYVYVGGPHDGKPARLLLFDRVGREGESLGAPLHRDVRALAHRLGFDRMTVEHTTAETIVASLLYGGRWVTTLLRTRDATVDVACEVVEEEHRAELARTRKALRDRGRVAAALRHAMLRQVDDELPFDEPLTEWGQQDGHLRHEWLRAYERGDDSFVFNFDRYPVFTREGRPRAPQVCIDFITETLELASGTSYSARGNRPTRRVGAIDFDALIDGNRRQVETFLTFARRSPDKLEVEALPQRDRVQYKFKRRFFRRLTETVDRYRTGDIVVIRGYAPWDHYAVPHYHTFFVYESDPVTGMPILLAGNAGKPRVQSWEPVMARTPLRSIHYRVRPKHAWLTAAIDAQAPATSAPLRVEFR